MDGGGEGNGTDGSRRESHQGSIEKALPSDQYQVKLGDGRVVRAMVARESRALLVKVQPGDRVELVLYPYDPTRGSILRKLP